MKRPHKCKRDEGYILPVSLDVRLGEGGMKSAVCMAVGEFFERATCQLLPGERLRPGSCSFCPDGHNDGEYYEVKGSGQSSWIVEESQLECYRAMEEEGKIVSYVLWSYRGRPALKKSCQTRRDIFQSLADRVVRCWVLSLQDLERVLRTSQRMVMRHQNGEEMGYYRPGKKLLPTRPLVRVSRTIVEIETVPFEIRDLSVVVLGKDRWVGNDSICEEVPF